MEEPNFHLLDHLGVLKRRRWWFIVPVALAIVAGGLLALLLPREYRSHATLAVTSPTVSSDLARVAPLEPAERARAISHELLGRSVLERVAREEGFTEPGALESAIAAIRARAHVSVPRRLVDTRSGPDTFLIAYEARSPQEAQRVANRLAEVFVEQQSRSRTARAEDTSAILAAQLESSQRRLNATEARLREAKEQYMGQLPEQMQANLHMVTGLRQQLSATAMSLRGEQDRLSMIESQIDAMEQGVAELVSQRGSAQQGPQTRLVTLRRQLTDARRTYTDRHPEIRRLQAEIAAAQAELEAERLRPREELEPELQTSPAYQRLLADREAVRLRIRDLERAESRAREEIAQYQARVEAAPRIEQQFTSLSREYDLERQQHRQLAERHQAALLAEELERRHVGEQFSLLFPAFLPTEPFKPNVSRVLLFSLLFGFVVGGGLAVGREYLDRSVYDTRTLQHEFELPVLAEIPRITEA